MTVTTIGSREARQKWRDLLDIAYRGETDTIIERNGKPVAVLIPYEDYAAIEEALDELRAARRAVAAYETLKEHSEQGRSYAELRAGLEQEESPDE
jgi:prevent-host-death family protein